MDYINKSSDLPDLIDKVNHYLKSLYGAYISYLKCIIEINEIYVWYLSGECGRWTESFLVK
ncbi:hypothetical protein GCM10007876_22540 [Litoribrevibacter albus]|uniref:Uncharacterized protein n=1 Tax=Litoribrevibacter albus TaxID=1473156 RepID=A0AA37SB16_9GAMM|nr:hypothetical protein GCM10007876_22540 [Litoribrevibacter albus]